MDLFEYATKKKVRFTTSRGSLSVEDLWDLPLVSNSKTKVTLDSVARAVNKELKEGDEESFVQPSASNYAETQKMAIVKHIIQYRVALKEQNEKAEETRQQKETILGIINTKKNEALQGKSLEELQAML